VSQVFGSDRTDAQGGDGGMGLCGVYVQGTRRGGVHMLEIVRGDAGWDGGAGVHECLRCVLRMCRLIGILRMEAELAEGTWWRKYAVKGGTNYRKWTNIAGERAGVE
jgi:hypothetical protein